MSNAATKDEHATDGHGHGDHHIVSAGLLTGILIALLVLTVITYLASLVDMGRSVNIVVALLIACVKAGLVATFFMHLKWDKPFNTVVLLVSLLFVGLFLAISTIDTAENQYRKDGAKYFDYQEKMQKARKSKGITYHEKHDLGGPPKGDGDVGAAPSPGAAPVEDQSKARELASWAKGALGTLPAQDDSPQNPVTDAKADLGKMLYFDARLSKNHDISCNSCHDLSAFGVDGKPTSPGHKGQLGSRNSPTVLNASLQTIGQFWDARAATVEEQATMPITNPVEMAMPDNAAVEAVLKSIPGYGPLFEAAFPGDDQPITMENVGKAIGAFERRLMTPSRFDAFMSGQHDRLSAKELEGLETFKEVGCTQCHTGKTLGGTMVDKLGKLRPYESKDKGAFENTGQPKDMFQFKVAQLRNVTKTGPWFHDGSVTSLAEAVRLMGAHQLDKDLSSEQVEAIVAFLGTLEGELDPALAAKPTLPESGPDTPKPDPN